MIGKNQIRKISASPQTNLAEWERMAIKMISSCSIFVMASGKRPGCSLFIVNLFQDEAREPSKEKIVIYSQKQCRWLLIRHLQIHVFAQK